MHPTSVTLRMVGVIGGLGLLLGGLIGWQGSRVAAPSTQLVYSSVPPVVRESPAKLSLGPVIGANGTAASIPRSNVILGFLVPGMPVRYMPSGAFITALKAAARPLHDTVLLVSAQVGTPSSVFTRLYGSSVVSSGNAASAFGIAAYPTWVMIGSRRVLGTIEGAPSASALVQFAEHQATAPSGPSVYRP